MTSINIIISAANGLHARPAGELVKLAKSFEGVKITLSTEAKTVNATSMLSVLSLGLKQGTKVSINAEAADEESELKAVESIADFILSVND